ncbi:galactose-1-epimerase, partial [Vibrio parahaemolyticus]|nr:galactose-1-epimerase [Vibrio parahaemolyticus]
FDKRRWKVVEQNDQQVTFSLRSPDGDLGYPGHLYVKVTYTLTDENELALAYDAKTDNTSPVNLTTHASFNLAGEAS